MGNTELSGLARLRKLTEEFNAEKREILKSAKRDLIEEIKNAELNVQRLKNEFLDLTGKPFEFSGTGEDEGSVLSGEEKPTRKRSKKIENCPEEMAEIRTYVLDTLDKNKDGVSLPKLTTGKGYPKASITYTERVKYVLDILIAENEVAHNGLLLGKAKYLRVSKS